MRSSRRILRCLATVAGGIAILSCGSDTVGPEATVTSVSVSPRADSLIVGGTVTLEATVHGENGTVLTDRKVFWNTEDATIATVSDQGMVTGVKPGDVRVAASAAGHSDVATITVLRKPVTSVKVTPPSATIELHHTTSFQAKTYDADGNELTGRSISWSTSNDDVATVDGGTVTGVGAGSATITATSEGQKGTATVEVTPPPAASVEISPKLAAVQVGGTVQLTATARDASGDVIPGAPVTWSSSDQRIATVSSNGVVRGVASGVVDITAQSGKAGASIQVAVLPLGRQVGNGSNPQP